MIAKRVVLETNEDISLSVAVGQEIKITVEDGRSFICRFLGCQSDEDEEITTKQMLTFAAKNDKEPMEEPDLYSVANLKDKA